MRGSLRSSHGRGGASQVRASEVILAAICVPILESFPLLQLAFFALTPYLQPMAEVARHKSGYEAQEEHLKVTIGIWLRTGCKLLQEFALSLYDLEELLNNLVWCT